jgi:hypothetical protein
MDYGAMYFGIRKGKEHCLHFETARMEPDAASIEGFPFSIFQLDTGFLESWKVTDLPDGRVHWTKVGTLFGLLSVGGIDLEVA